MTLDELEWGPVKVTGGKHKGRIASLDECEDGKHGICYFGTIIFHASSADILLRYLDKVTTDDLWTRKEEISRLISPHAKRRLQDGRQLDLLHEYHYIYNILMERWEHARHKKTRDEGRKIFISHSSKDKQFARWLSVDLANLGHKPWLDEWQIKVGQSIPSRISEGLQESDVVVVVLSPNSVESGWVEREWQAKYWDEVSEKRIMVIPAMLQDCVIPMLLKTKKYADFRKDHSSGVGELLGALDVGS